MRESQNYEGLSKGICTIAMIYLCIICYSQDYFFRQYDISDGLPHNEIFSITQRADKTLWLGTESGLVSFDGRKFKVYSKSDGLHSNEISYIKEDRDERLWVCTDQGISLLYQGKFLEDSLLNSQIIKSPLEIEFIGESVYIIAHDRIYIIHDSIIKSKEFKHPVTNESIHNIHSATSDLSSNIYLGTADGDILRLNLEELSLKTLEYPQKYQRSYIRSLLVAESGHLIASSEDIHSFKDDNYLSSTEYCHNRNHKMVQQNDSTIVLFSEGGGLNFLNLVTGRCTNIDKANGLPTGILFDGLIDHEDNIWMASYGEGLIKFRDRSLLHYSIENGLPDSYIQDITIWNEHLLAATNKGIARFKQENLVDTIADREWCYSITSKNDKELFYSRYDQLRSWSENGTSSVVSDTGYVWIYHHLNSIYAHNTSNVYELTQRKITKLPFHWTHEAISLDRAIVFRNPNKLTIKYPDSIHHISKLNPDRWGAFRTMDRLNDSTFVVKSDEHIHVVTSLSDSVIIQNVDISDLPAVNLLNSMDIEDGDIWFSGPNIFIKMDLEALIQNKNPKITEFNLDVDSYNSLFFDDGIIVQNGLLYGHSARGLTIFDESKYLESYIAPKLALKSIKLFGEIVPSDSDQFISGVFQHSENNLSFEMRAISLSNPQAVEYRYRLKANGSAASWSTPDKNSQVNFASLKDGNYNFEFTAKNGSGKWNEEPLNYSFIISRPFWKKTEFWISISAALLILCTTALLFLNRLKLRRQKEVSEILINSQETDRRKLAREIHDGIGQKVMLIRRRAKNMMLTDIEELARGTLQETRLISQGLHPAVLFQLGLCEALRDMAEKIDAHTETFIDHSIIEIDSLISEDKWIHIFRIAQELLTNVIKHSRATEASLILTKTDQGIQLTVSDNGTGFDTKKDNPREFNLGFTSIDERVKLIGGNFEITSNKNGTIASLYLL